MIGDLDALTAHLFEMQDTSYRAFHASMNPALDRERLIGVRVPMLRKLARQLHGTALGADFLAALPHRYYDENNLHALMLCDFTAYGMTLAALEQFMPCVDNLVTCDLINPRAFQRRPADLPRQIRRWLQSDHPYTVRLALNVLERLYLGTAFDPCYLDEAGAVRSEESAVRSMVAVYFNSALVKQYDATLTYLKSGTLPVLTRDQALQKALDNHHITPEQKRTLRALQR